MRDGREASPGQIHDSRSAGIQCIVSCTYPVVISVEAQGSADAVQAASSAAVRLTGPCARAQLQPSRPKATHGKTLSSLLLR